MWNRLDRNSFDNTFDESLEVEQVQYEEPVQIQEDSIEEEEITVNRDTEDLATFTVVDGATQRGKRKLVSSDGFTFVVKRQNRDESIDWRCSVRNKNTSCPVMVRQTGEDFTANGKDHTHGGKPGILNAVKVQQQVKVQALNDLFEPAPSIVDDIIEEMIDVRQPDPSRPSYANLIRMTNRHREKTRPKDPVDLDFEIDAEFLSDQTSPNFLRDDITVGNNRHLVFATDQQLDMLSKAKTWYIDGTFKIVKRPFYQLLSIHAFVKSDGNLKQFPGVFVLMSSKRKRDYKKVFQSVVNMLPSQPTVKEFVVDFEDGLWRALHSVFEDPAIHGCSFHWGQAVWRHVQELGLQTDYNSRDKVYKFIRKVLVLPFLPAEQIQPTFAEMKTKANTPALQQLMTYIENTWITCTLWTPNNWSVYNRSIRKNNDVEGWHHRINRKAKKSNLSFYVFILLLFKEARVLPAHLKLVSEGKMKRSQTAKHTSMQGKIFGLWEKLRDGGSVNSFLKKCAKLYGPTN